MAIEKKNKISIYYGIINETEENISSYINKCCWDLKTHLSICFNECT